MASTSGFISMILTPNGLSVNSLHLRICSRSVSAFMLPAAIKPKPPALDTAAANSPVAILAIPPCIKGYFVPKRSANFIDTSTNLLIHKTSIDILYYHSK